MPYFPLKYLDYTSIRHSLEQKSFTDTLFWKSFVISKTTLNGSFLQISPLVLTRSLAPDWILFIFPKLLTSTLRHTSSYPSLQETHDPPFLLLESSKPPPPPPSFSAPPPHLPGLLREIIDFRVNQQKMKIDDPRLKERFQPRAQENWQLEPNPHLVAYISIVSISLDGQS